MYRNSKQILVLKILTNTINIYLFIFFTNKQLFYKSLTGETLPFRVNFEFPKLAAGGGKNINLTLPF